MLTYSAQMQYTSRIIALLAWLAVLLALAPPTRAGIEEDCVQSRDPYLGIGGCTAVIRFGKWRGKDLAWAYYNRGIDYAMLGEHRLAIEDYDQALRLDPDDALAYYNRGAAHDEIGEYRRAIEDYDQALRLNPGDADACQKRGISYENLGEHERAARDWEQAIRIDGASRAKWWQQYLKWKGHYAGAIDGIYGTGMWRGLLACARDPNC